MKKLVVVLAVLAASSMAMAIDSYFEDFSSGIGDWNPYQSNLAAVDGHLQITNPANPSDNYFSGAYSKLGGYMDTFGAGFSTTVDVYIDLTDSAIAAGSYGFDLSQAINNDAGSHAQDNIFHVGAVDVDGEYQVLLNASHNSDFYANPYKLQNDQGGNYATFTESGWYTFGFDFAASTTPDKVDITFSVLDDSGNLFWSAQELSQDAQYTLSNVGGHRYMWFTFADADKLLVDNVGVEVSAVPVPGAVLLGGIGTACVGWMRRRKSL